MTNREKILQMTVEDFLTNYTEDTPLEIIMCAVGCSFRCCPVFRECDGDSEKYLNKWLDEEVSEWAV